jgi:hypothetical protein
VCGHWDTSLVVCVCERTKSWEILSLEIFISSFWSWTCRQCQRRGKRRPLLWLTGERRSRRLDLDFAFVFCIRFSYLFLKRWKRYRPISAQEMFLIDFNLARLS